MPRVHLLPAPCAQALRDQLALDGAPCASVLQRLDAALHAHTEVLEHDAASLLGSLPHAWALPGPSSSTAMADVF